MSPALGFGAMDSETFGPAGQLNKVGRLRLKLLAVIPDGVPRELADYVPPCSE